jgi:hypothetical protein
MKSGECTPAKSESTALAIQRRVGMPSSTNWQKGWGHGEAGMESEEGTAFEFLPRREPCGELPRRSGMAAPWQTAESKSRLRFSRHDLIPC